ncbi:chaplin [Kitasatospora sp. NPDC058170]|uniref:chaplin n=1 Tax=Kitasatospora sp. NPDC058170 TaxID=3346364 RepID=UPI0036D7B101
MTEHVRVRNSAGRALRRRVRVGVAGFVVAALPLAALAPASAADQDPEASTVSALTGAQESGVADDLRAMGLEVRTAKGLILAWGQAVTVNQAEARFADKNPTAMFTGPDQTGDGYLLIRGTSIAPWIGFTAGSGVAIQSVSNESDGETVVYDQATGHLNVDEDHHTAENLPAPHATADASRRAGTTHGAVTFSHSPTPFGQQLQIPINIEAGVCGNTIAIISILNPAIGNSCINA